VGVDSALPCRQRSNKKFAGISHDVRTKANFRFITMTPSSLETRNLKKGGIAHVLAPHPDDFDAIAVTLRFLQRLQWRIVLSVMTGGENGVADDYEGAASRVDKRELRRQEQRDSCTAFGLDLLDLNFLELDHDGASYVLIRQILRG